LRCCRVPLVAGLRCCRVPLVAGLRCCRVPLVAGLRCCWVPLVAGLLSEAGLRLTAHAHHGLTEPTRLAWHLARLDVTPLVWLLLLGLWLLISKFLLQFLLLHISALLEAIKVLLQLGQTTVKIFVEFGTLPKFLLGLFVCFQNARQIL